MHRRALQREAQLQVEIERLEALVRLREQQLFGLRPRPPRRRLQRPRMRPTPTRPPRRPRGQQRGGPKSETPRLFPPPCRCRRQGLAVRPVPLLAVWSAVRRFPRHQDSTILEIDVRAHRRVIRRRRYRPTCSCGAHPGIVTAPPPDRLIPKSMLGISIGDGALGQVSVLPADLSALGGRKPTAWTCRWAP